MFGCFVSSLPGSGCWNSRPRLHKDISPVVSFSCPRKQQQLPKGFGQTRIASKAGKNAVLFLQATTVSSQITLAQQDLLDYVQNLDLGRKALKNSQTKAIVNEKIALLELMNPTPCTVDSADLEGKWRLIYTDSENILGVNRPKIFQPVGTIYQEIFLSSQQVRNSETVNILGIPVTNSVTATFTKSPPKRIFVQFQKFRFGPIQFPAPSIARGFLDTTFLDQRMRISRGNRKSVFVLVKD
eukprot:jgi/Galph1/2543/GphlegSOOS_G1218.1